MRFWGAEMGNNGWWLWGGGYGEVDLWTIFVIGVVLFIAWLAWDSA